LGGTSLTSKEKIMNAKTTFATALIVLGLSACAARAADEATRPALPGVNVNTPGADVRVNPGGAGVAVGTPSAGVQVQPPARVEPPANAPLLNGNRAEINITGDNRPDQWRYKWENNRWWYYGPDNRWMWYSEPGGWTYADAAPSYSTGYGGAPVAPPVTTYAAPSTTYYYYPNSGYYYYGSPGIYIGGRGWGVGIGGHVRWR
jgi:hypothetical protein